MSLFLSRAAIIGRASPPAGGAFPVVSARAAQTANSSNNIAVTIPAHSVGDLLIVVAVTGGGSASPSVTATAGSGAGWSAFFIGGNAGSTSPALRSFQKIADGDDALVLNRDIASDDWSIAAWVIQGGALPSESSEAVRNQLNPDTTLPAFTAAAVNTFLLIGVMSYTDAVSGSDIAAGTAPSGWDNLQNVGVGDAAIRTKMWIAETTLDGDTITPGPWGVAALAERKSLVVIAVPPA